MQTARKWHIEPASPYVAEWTSVEWLARHRGRWERLAKAAVEPNPFYGPDFLIASVRDLHNQNIRCLAVFADGDRESDLIGLFPVQMARFSQGALIPALEFYRNEFVCSTAPLIDRADPVGVWQSFFDAFRREQTTPRILLSHLLPSNGVLRQSLDETMAANGLPQATVETFERAAVAPQDKGFDAYIARYSRHRRKDFGRRHRRLEEQGAVSVRTISGGAEAQQALEDFLRIEKSGWKGERGTAMACNAQEEAFARDVFGGDGIEFDVLSLDGKAIAVTVHLVSNGIAYSIKTAYDESHSAISPGAILDLQAIRNVTTGRYQRVDSCAMAKHPIEAYWLEKQPIASLALGAHASVSRAKLEGLVTTLRSVARLKSWIKEQVGVASV